MSYIENPKMKGSGILACIPQKGRCPVGCADCFFQSGRSFLEPLDENLPNIPTRHEGFVVRMNDGNDSNVQRDLVVSTAKQFQDAFYNTSIPKDLGSFDRPVVLTVNPSTMTDTDFHKINPVPDNLMFVRIRVNAWNYDIVDAAVQYYAKERGVPVVLTFMAYYTENIPEYCKDRYEWKKRTVNSYWCPKKSLISDVMEKYTDHNVYLCDGLCKTCGNCLREYYATKYRMGN